MPETKETFEDLKKYINELPVGLMLFNSSYELLSWNKQAEEILELSNEDLQNNNFGNLKNQLAEVLEVKEVKEKELVGLLNPHKAKKIITTDENIILMITETFQETIGEMSHELRRPITNIKTLAESLLMGAKDDPDIAERFLNNINGEIDRLTNLVNRLLNISKIKSGTLELSKKKINLHEMTNDAFKLLQPNADKKQSKLINEVPEPYEILADPEHIDHVVQNLVENAIKYSGDEATISVKPGPVPGSFQVDDTGIGIAPEHINKIFDRFFRVDRTKAKGSSGLGLAIVKNIVDLHGGKIKVESELQKGTSFIVYLPL